MDDPKQQGLVDKRIWEASPGQQALIALFVGWVFAAGIELLLLGQTDVTGLLKTLLRDAFEFRLTGSFWSPILVWAVAPFVAFYLTMWPTRHYRRHLLAVDATILTAVLVIFDLQVKLF